MNNRLSITEISVENKKITTRFDIQGEWKKLFNVEKDFYVSYNVDVKNTPSSIAVIPVLGTLLTLSWLFDGEIIVEELDKDFYNSIPEIKKGYQTMFPHVHFAGTLTVKKIVDNQCASNHRTAQLFSGGADAFSTLLTYLEEKPSLLTIWGADVAEYNDEAWAIVESAIKSISKQFNLSFVSVKSNFRDIISPLLHSQSELVQTGDDWWHGFQSGTGLLCLIAPYAYSFKIKTLYIASSFTQSQWGSYTCSSDPIIDNATKFCGCQVNHDGYEYTRQEKIQNICSYAIQHNTTIPLRVCWLSKDGNNCCQCEKCRRTMLELYAERQDPLKYGFNYGTDLNSTMDELKFDKIRSYYLNKAQISLKRNYKKSEVLPSLRWVYSTKFPDNSNYYLRKKPKKNIKEFIYSLTPNFVKTIYKKILKRK